MALQYVPGSHGALLLTGGGDKQVRVVNVERGAVKPFSCHEARVRCLAAVDGSVILSGERPQTAHGPAALPAGMRCLPCRPSPQQKQPLPAGNDRCSAICTALNLTLLALAGADDGGVRLFDLRQSQAATPQLQEQRSRIGERNVPTLLQCIARLAADMFHHHSFCPL
jgi:hypothetical protein